MRNAIMSLAGGLGALVLAVPAGAAIYIKLPDIPGEAAAQGGLLTIEGLRWEAKGRTQAVRPPGQPRYRAEGGRLVRVDDGGEGPASMQRLADPLRRPERDPAAVLTRPVGAGPGMLAVRGHWAACREGAAFPEAELRDMAGSGVVTIEQVTVVSCADDSFALNYERIKA